MLALFFTVQAFGQFTTDFVPQNPLEGQVWLFDADVDSLTADTSSAFDISPIDNADSLQFVGLITGGTVSTQKISAKLQVSADNSTWYDAETILTADSATTVLSKDVKLDIFGPYARVIIWGATGNNNGISISGYLYGKKDD